MIRKLPLWPTLVVGAAIAVMIALGVWQLQRKAWKENLLVQYAAAQSAAEEVAWPRTQAEAEAALFHRSRFTCSKTSNVSAIAGRSETGESGWAHVVTCQIAGGGETQVALGWSREPSDVAWAGGDVIGIVAPAADGARMIASPPLAGLAPLAKPDPADMPNNHLSYAMQWFFFAATALVIYLLAVRKKWRE